MADLLSLRYVPISQAELFDGNAKLHNLDKIIQSIARYGFKSACKWEGTLNNGRGGIVAGNGRVEALRLMEERGDDLPVGIAQDEAGEWCVPVLFGAEASSEATARAYALDDNNLTVLGGDFTAEDLLGLYDQEMLTSELQLLAGLGESSVTFDDSFVENVLQQLLSDSTAQEYSKSSYYVTKPITQEVASSSTTREYSESSYQPTQPLTQEVASDSTDRQYSESSLSNARSYADVTDENVEKANQKLQSQFNTPAKKEEDNLITCPHCGGDFVYR